MLVRRQEMYNEIFKSSQMCCLDVVELEIVIGNKKRKEGEEGQREETEHLKTDDLGVSRTTALVSTF